MEMYEDIREVTKQIKSLLENLQLCDLTDLDTEQLKVLGDVSERLTSDVSKLVATKGTVECDAN